jgi:F-type H+-transporting ATPase subunit c
MLSKLGSMVVLAMIVLGWTSVAMAQETPAAHGPAATGWSVTDIGIGRLGGSIGAGLVIIGGAAGISKIGLSACESTARQPEAGGRIFLTMIITAAMIEGATFFAVLACYQAATAK